MLTEQKQDKNEKSRNVRASLGFRYYLNSGGVISPLLVVFYKRFNAVLAGFLYILLIMPLDLRQNGDYHVNEFS